MRRPLTLLALCALLAAPAAAEDAPPAGGALPSIRVASDAAGWRLRIDGRDTMVLGVNWDHVPVGQNYAWNLFAQPDAVIEEALGRDMPLLRAMGANAIRVYAGIPPRWVRYIHERWGIWTVLNHPMARYGLTLDGVWVPSVDYSDPRVRAAVKREVLALVDEFKDTPGLLMWLLGNENNYGLHWRSSEIEALPEGKRDEARARHLYSLFGEVIREVKAKDPSRPVAIANGDVQYLDLIAEECRGLDVFGANVYRGRSMRDLYDVVKEKLGVPVMFTEFGADAFDAKANREDDVTQARYLQAQWREIYEQAAGQGKAGNAIGGLVFQWSDGWWKYGQESNLDVHDTNASWPNGGYPEDLVPGRNNMNEEWWGITAKGPADARGLYDVYPRTAYYVLQAAWRLPAYAPSTDGAAIRAHFDAIDPVVLARNYRADRASLAAAEQGRVRVSNLRLSLETYSTGGERLDRTTLPYGFDHMESFFADVTVQPAPNVSGTLSVNVLGNVAANPIDEIFYERRGRSLLLQDGAGQVRELRGVERVKVYGVKASWDEPLFRADAFYRTGHYHWQYEGDLFGVYREANYGENIDIYDADAPNGVELAGKGPLEGVKVAFGPQLWWGANPAVIGKVRHAFGPVTATLLHHEELAQQLALTSSGAIPQQRTRRTALALAFPAGPFGLEVGGLWAGWNKVDLGFQTEEETAGGRVLRGDRITETDTLGARAKVTFQRGRWNWYAEGAYQGLVADGGPTAALTYTGWTLKLPGTGNVAAAATGLAVNVGELQISPNVLWQKPLVGPNSFEGGAQRNTLPAELGGREDPFAVRGNRETVAGELLVTWDPTPATWLWAWDNDVREDAPLAGSVGFVYRHQPTSMDASIAFTELNVPFPNGAPPPHDLWEVRARVASRPAPDLRIVAHAWAGTAEPNGSNPRLVHRQGMDFRAGWRRVALAGFVKHNDYGPYDYHRDFNLTFPLQLMGDLSYALDVPRWFGNPQTRLGVRGTMRWLDRDSPRFLADPADPLLWGNEYEIRTYLNVTL
jgi:hypothetical protein